MNGIKSSILMIVVAILVLLALLFSKRELDRIAAGASRPAPAQTPLVAAPAAD